MKSADRNSLEEQTRLVSRYVAGDLSRSERAEFEAWLVASPELAAEVEMERRLRRGMASAARRGWLRRHAAAVPAPRRRWPMAIAASVLVALGLSIAWTLPRQGGEERSSPLLATRSPAGLPLVVRLGKVRGIEQGPDIKLSLGQPPAELTLDPEVVVLTCEDGSIDLECPGGGIPRTPQYPEYEVDLVHRASSALTWRSARQQPGANADLSFTVREVHRLKAGDYDVLVRGVSADHAEVVGRFWLQVSPD